MECCCTKGMLSYLILWIVHKKKSTGSEIADELKKRRGTKPSPGTIYPALMELKEKGLISMDSEKRYSLTKKGILELHNACKFMHKMFFDIHEMFKCK
jgi:PadR family transcriptional regulator PadR